jgi:tRNA(Ile)-lysidine synthase
LLPLLRQYNPGVEQALLRLADIAKEDNAFIERQAFELWDAMARQENDAIYLDRKQIAGLPIALQRQLLRAAMAKLAGDARDIEAIHIEAVRGLLDKAVGKRISLPHGLICQKGYDELVLASEAWQSRLPPCPFPPLSGEIPLKVPGETDFAGWKAIASIVPKQADGGHCRPQLLGAWQPVEIAASPRFVGARGNDRGESHSDHERSKGEESRLPQGKLCQALVADCDLGKTGIKLFVRHRQPGDRFQPLGMDMPKKLREFMVDTKIPRCWRGHVPIVCSPQQIIWVVGWRIDDRVKVTEASEEILRLEFVRTE